MSCDRLNLQNRFEMTALVNSRNLFGFIYVNFILLYFFGIANGNYWRTLTKQGANPSGDMCADDKIDCLNFVSCNSLTNSRQNCKVWPEYCKWECGACWELDETPNCPEFRGCNFYSSSQNDCEEWPGQGCIWTCGRCIEEPVNDIAGCYKLCGYCDCMLKEGCIMPHGKILCRQSKIDHSTKMGKVPKCEIGYDELHECERLTNKYILYDGSICFLPAENHDDCPEPSLVIAVNLNGKAHKSSDNILYEAEYRDSDYSEGFAGYLDTVYRLVNNVEVEVTEDAPLYTTYVTVDPRGISDTFCVNYGAPDILLDNDPGARYELVMSFIENIQTLRGRVFTLKIGKLTLPIKIDNYPFEGSFFSQDYVYDIRVVFFIRKENDRTILDAVGSEYLVEASQRDLGYMPISLCAGDQSCSKFETEFDIAAFYVIRF